MIDFGIGDPREPTDRRSARRSSTGCATAGLPARGGLPELREAIAAWAGRRFGSRLDPDTRDHPDARLEGGDLLVRARRRRLRRDTGRRRRHRARGYPVYERGALFARARPLVACRCARSNGFLPDLDAIDDETWDALAVFWVNYPNNPTGAVAPLAFYERSGRAARASTTSCSPPTRRTRSSGSTSRRRRRSSSPIATNVVVFNTLSKRSSMTGYRSRLRGRRSRADRGAARVPADRRHRAAGVRPARVGRRVGRRGARRARPARATGASGRSSSTLSLAGVRVAGSDATMYLWARGSRRRARRRRSRGGCSSTASSSRRARIFGPAGEGYFRIALVPTEEECARAAAILERVL